MLGFVTFIFVGVRDVSEIALTITPVWQAKRLTWSLNYIAKLFSKKLKLFKKNVMLKLKKYFK